MHVEQRPRAERTMPEDLHIKVELLEVDVLGGRVVHELVVRHRSEKQDGDQNPL